VALCFDEEDALLPILYWRYEHRTPDQYSISSQSMLSRLILPNASCALHTFDVKSPTHRAHCDASEFDVP
jgi:hypothetical protein